MTSPQQTQITWLDQLVRIEHEARRLTDPLSDAQFAWRPGAGRWSVGECLDHLAITTGLMVGNARPALERGRAAGMVGGLPFKYGWLGGWFVRTMEEPGKRGMRAPPNFVPPADLARSAVLGKFFAAQEELRDAMESGHGLALDRIKAPSSAKGAGWLRLNLAAWFAATLAHQRRHLKQVERVTGAPGFPR